MMAVRLAGLTRLALAFLVGVTFFPDGAAAQDATFRVGLLAGVATVDDEAPVAVAGSFGYRFTPTLWFETELTWIDEGPFNSGSLAIPGPLPTPGAVTSPNPADGVIPSGESGPMPVVAERPTLVGTLGLRWAPAGFDRFQPYLTGAVGLHHTEERLRLEGEPETVLSESAVTGSSFTTGGGASLRVSGPISVDIDVRYLRLSGGRDVLRLAGGVSIRF
jgi:hypothetical protein